MLGGERYLGEDPNKDKLPGDAFYKIKGIAKI
jgi:hypothetical protein